MCFVVGPWKPLGDSSLALNPVAVAINLSYAEAASCLFVCHKARQKSLALDTKRSSLSFQSCSFSMAAAKEQKGDKQEYWCRWGSCTFFQTFTTAALNAFFLSLIVLREFLASLFNLDFLNREINWIFPFDEFWLRFFAIFAILGIFMNFTILLFWKMNNISSISRIFSMLINYKIFFILF